MRCGAMVVGRNEEKRIENCLKNPRNQTVEPIIVVVDDGSRESFERHCSVRGYVSNTSKRYDDLGGFVPRFQKVMFVKRLGDFVMNSCGDLARWLVTKDHSAKRC